MKSWINGLDLSGLLLHALIHSMKRVVMEKGYNAGSLVNRIKKLFIVTVNIIFSPSLLPFPVLVSLRSGSQHDFEKWEVAC